MLRKIQKERKSHLHRGGSLKSRRITVFWSVTPCNAGSANVSDERVVSVSERYKRSSEKLHICRTTERDVPPDRDENPSLRDNFLRSASAGNNTSVDRIYF